ncbi:MAG: antibiotic biosynthesis monooxygenase family protein [Parasphingorhabdus sp.]|uniref:putative quinol monooxygenase n=1 Tax=Parasphingorhabdus sp. TaxID=2709688 RepID=UPI00300315E0
MKEDWAIQQKDNAMSFARVYEMRVAAGQQANLLDALNRLSIVVRECEGYESFTILHNIDAPDTYMVIERWVSEEARKKSSNTLPSGLFKLITEALKCSPNVRNLKYLTD